MRSETCRHILIVRGSGSVLTGKEFYFGYFFKQNGLLRMMREGVVPHLESFAPFVLWNELIHVSRGRQIAGRRYLVGVLEQQAAVSPVTYLHPGEGNQQQKKGRQHFFGGQAAGSCGERNAESDCGQIQLPVVVGFP